MFRESFVQNLKSVEKALIESDFFKEANNAKFEQQIKANVLIAFMQSAVNASLNLEEIAIKNNDSKLQAEKLRAELEMGLSNFINEAKYKQSEALKSIVQSKAMARSVGDNAAINQSNAYVGFLNVVANASETDAVKEHTPNVINVIEQIDIRDLTEFDPIISKLLSEVQGLMQNKLKPLYIFAPKLELTLNEGVEIMGFTTHSKTRFCVDDKVMIENAKNYLFKSDKAGEFVVSFEAAGENGVYEYKDSVKIKVIQGAVDTQKEILQKF